MTNIDELSSLEKLGLIDISYSRLDTYATCPAKYFYTYVLKEERLFGAAATLGNIVHSVLEKVDWTEPLDLHSMHQTFREQRVNWDPDNQVGTDLIDVGYQILTEFYGRHKEEEFDVLAVELPFNIIIGSAYITGYIDQLYRGTNGRITVLDYKTGKYEVAAKDISQNLQLGLYAVAVSELYPAEDIVRAEMYYLRSGRRKGYDFTKDDLRSVREKLLLKVNDLIETNNFAYISGRPCSYCDFNNICPVGKKFNRR